MFCDVVFWLVFIDCCSVVHGVSNPVHIVFALLIPPPPPLPQFNPEIVFVSAGFDGAYGDPLVRFPSMIPVRLAKVLLVTAVCAEGELVYICM